MAGKATSVYLTVADKTTHKTELHRVFFNKNDLSKFIETDEFKEKYPAEKFYVVSEVY